MRRCCNICEKKFDVQQKRNGNQHNGAHYYLYSEKATLINKKWLCNDCYKEVIEEVEIYEAEK